VKLVAGAMNRSGAVVVALAAFLAVASAQVPSLGPCPDMSTMGNFTINKVSVRAFDSPKLHTLGAHIRKYKQCAQQ
jgi:hypothetical protein